jgi:type III protein arginine methyltransferase
LPEQDAGTLRTPAPEQAIQLRVDFTGTAVQGGLALEGAEVWIGSRWIAMISNPLARKVGFVANSQQDRLFDRPALFRKFGLDLIRAGRAEQALTLTRQALDARPDDPLIAALAQRISSHKLPGYHHSMLRDTTRNTAYRQAIEALAPGRTVLDIGTGSGLLAMLAARAGAAHVHACEAKPQLAATAREIVAANGLADRITIHSCHSGELDRLRDLGGGADLIVSEILSHDVLGENVLTALAHARAELAAPGALMIPERAAVRIALADQEVPHQPLGEVEGFDLSLFNRHFKQEVLHRPAVPDFRLRSAPADLLTFDFTTDIAMENTIQTALRSDGGKVNGIAQWIHITLGAGATYENQPGAKPGTHWRVGFYPIAPARMTRPGDAIAVHGWHDSQSIELWVDPS